MNEQKFLEDKQELYKLIDTLSVNSKVSIIVYSPISKNIGFKTFNMDQEDLKLVLVETYKQVN